MSEPHESAGGPPAEPYVPATQSLPEITIKAVILGIGLSVLLAGAWVLVFAVSVAAMVNQEMSATLARAVEIAGDPTFDWRTLLDD